jgi:hypothetical protein
MVAPARLTDPSLQDVRQVTVAAALATAARRWCSRADRAPAGLARLEWEQVNTAAGASSGSWRETDLARRTPQRRRDTLRPKNSHRRRRKPISGCGYSRHDWCITGAGHGGVKSRWITG